MDCNCIEDVSAKMIDHFKADAGDSVRAVCSGLGINLSTGGMSLSIPFTIHGTARGFNSRNGKSTYMVASFCPFCGKSAKKAEG